MTTKRLDRLLTLKQITTEIGISRSTIYRLMGKGIFPKPITIGDRSRRWPESVVKDWVAELKASAENGG